MRRVAAYIYKKAGKWKQSIALSKKDNLYKDCMETASQSGDHDLAEHLLVYFIEQVMDRLKTIGQEDEINITLCYACGVLTGEEGMLCYMSLCVL